MEHQQPMPPFASLLEQALSADLAYRCRRAYVHEVKNGLQPIYSGLEALNRALRPVTPGSPIEKCLTLTRQALTHHEQALDKSLNSLTGTDREAPLSLDVGLILNELGRFMGSDAAFRDVRMSIKTADAPACVHASRGLVRLVLLSLLVDCIDSLPETGGELAVSMESSDTAVIVQWLDTREVAHAWSNVDAQAAAVAGDGTLRLVVQLLVKSLQGTLESHHGEGKHRLRLTLPRED